MDLNEIIEEQLKTSITNAIKDCGPDIVSDMVRDNPDWWTRDIREVFETSIKKALKNDKLIREVLLEILADRIDDETIERSISDLASDKIEDILSKKIQITIKE